MPLLVRRRARPAHPAASPRPMDRLSVSRVRRAHLRYRMVRQLAQLASLARISLPLVNPSVRLARPVRSRIHLLSLPVSRVRLAHLWISQARRSAAYVPQAHLRMWRVSKHVHNAQAERSHR
jgi:hypothetical protein